MRELASKKLYRKVWLAIMLTASPATRGIDPVYNPAPNQVLIAHDQTADCEILLSTNFADKGNESMLNSVRRFQTYLQRLTGARPPVVGLDPVMTNSSVGAIIWIEAEAWKAVRPYCYRIGLVQPSATSSYRVPVVHFGLGDMDTARESTGHVTCVEKALDAFVQQYFGIPLAAIDDPKFDWPAHHRNRLAINYADFQPSQSPPSNPADGAQTK